MSKNEPDQVPGETPFTIPRTEQAVAKPAEATPPANKNGQPRVVSGEQLRPRMDVESPEQEFPYWLGALDSCPYETVHVAGLTFQKSCNPPIPDPESPKTMRMGLPVPGTIRPISRRQLDLLVARLPFMIFRQMPGTILKGTRPAAIKLRIPTEEEVQALRQRNRNTRSFVPRPGDQPISDHIYLVPAPDWHRDHELPECLTKTGVEYPAEDATPKPMPKPAHDLKVGYL